MDDDFRYSADIINGYDNRTFNRNFADGDFNTGADFNIYPENFSGLSVYSFIIAVDRSKNVSDDTRNFRTAGKIYSVKIIQRDSPGIFETVSFFTVLAYFFFAFTFFVGTAPFFAADEEDTDLPSA